MSPALWLPYVRFLLNSKGRHGLHSPFAYGFVEEVLQKKAGSLAEDLSLPPERFQALDFQYLIRIIAYWKPRQINLFPELIAVGSALEVLFPSIPIYNTEPESQPEVPVLGVGKVGLTDRNRLPFIRDLVSGNRHAVVLLDAAQSRRHRELAETLLTQSAWPMGIDFWNGIFLASDPRFRMRQRFRLKPFF